MDKLLYYLNEYQEEISEDEYPFFWKETDLHDNINIRQIISKDWEFIAWIVEKKKFKPYHAYTDFLYWASSRIEFENWPTIVSVNKQLYDSILCALALSDKPLELLSSIIL